MSAAVVSPPPRPAAPALLRHAPAFVLLAIAIADAGRIADPDLWGHIAFGRLFLRSGLTGHDPFNYSVPGHLWVIHEWLAEVMMARTYDLGGILGLKLWKFACTSATVVMLAMAVAETGAALPLQAAVLIAASMALLPLMQFRPQLYSYIFLAALMELLARENYGRRSPLWLAVPMLALWANLHGGFIVGVAALVLYSGVVIIQDLRARRGSRRAARLAAVTVASTIATLLNPFGMRAWAQVLAALVNPVTRKEMVDWQPLLEVLANSQGLNSGAIFFALVALMLVVLAIAWVATPRGGDLALVAVAALMGAGAFNVVRNMPLAVIAAVAPLAHHLQLVIDKFRGPGASPAAGRPFNRAGQAVIAAAALLLTFGHDGLLSPRLRAAMDYPAGAVAFMKSHRLSGNVLARFEWGQYVIFHLAPSSRIFIDGRVDLVYPPAVVDEYLDFYAGRAGGARLLDAYPHDYVMMPVGSPAAVTVSTRADWKAIYRDSVVVLFARADSAAAHLPGPSTGVAPASEFP